MKPVLHQLRLLLRRKQALFNYSYAFFLVFITPVAIPLTIMAVLAGKVTRAHVLWAVGLYSFSALGITLGYHRLVTHRAFQAKPWLKYLLLVGGSFAMQGTPASWASLHIQHHRYSDKPGDPHSPHQGGFWRAHCGWIFHDYSPQFRRFGKWLLKDKEVRHVSKYYLYYSNLGLLIPFLAGGWTGLVVAGLFRLFLSSHMTWSINSVCHKFGSRFYPNTPDKSRNHFLVALFTFGEGWHNNHHRYLQMPFFGHRWYQIDLGKWFLIGFKWCGWIWGLRLPALSKTPDSVLEQA